MRILKKIIAWLIMASAVFTVVYLPLIANGYGWWSFLWGTILIAVCGLIIWLISLAMEWILE